MLEGQRGSGSKWQARWWSPAPAVFCTEFDGYFDVDAVPLLVDGFEAVLAASPGLFIRSFHDWQKVSAYSSQARTQYTEDSKPIMPFVELIDVLFGSRLVAMAVSVSNIVLNGKLHPLSDRATFEERRASEIIAPRRPLTPGIVRAT